MTTTTKPLTKKQILANFAFSDTHGAGWYVRVSEKTTKAARVTTIAGPFASRRDAIAFRILFVDPNQIGSIGCNEYSASDVRYILATNGGEGQYQTKLISPTKVRMAMADADEITVKVCFDMADDAIRYGR